jgi:hypothetical protein
VLGVSSKELTDTTLQQSNNVTHVELALEDVSMNLIALYISVAAIDELSRTVQEQRFYKLTRLYATYALALALSGSLSMFGVSRLTDGKAEFNRFNEIESIVEAIGATLATLKLKLAAAFGELGGQGATPAQQTFSTLLVSPLGLDPVTNA